MFSYRQIIRQGWQVTWQNKYLWFFGLFAALLGNGGDYEIIIRGLSGDAESNLFPTLKNIAGTGFFSANTLANIPVLIARDPLNMLFIFLLGILALVLFGFLVWLVIVSQAALVNNAALAISRKKHDFAAGLETGTRCFWPVFGLNFTLRIVIGISFALLSLPVIVMIGSASAAAAPLYALAFVVFIPLSLALSFVVKYAIAYVVIKKYDFLAAITAGWALFRRHWLVSLEMALILFLINFTVGLGMFIGFLILTVPFLFLALVFHSLAAAAGFWIVIALAFIFLLAVVIVTGAGLAAFQISTWTALFIELVGAGGMSKVTRLMGKLTN